MKKNKGLANEGYDAKGEKPQKNPTHARSSEKGGRRTEKEERECEKNKQTQTVISVQTIKRKSPQRRKTILNF